MRARSPAHVPARARRSRPASASAPGHALETEHADAAHVTLEQGVHRLRGREGDERDARTLLTEIGEQHAQRLGHAFGNARGGAV